MIRTMTTLLLIAISAIAMAGALEDSASIYLPMDKDNILVKPAGAELTLLGAAKPIFRDGARGQAIAIDSEGVSIKGIKLSGEKLMDGEQGTLAFWMKPLLDYGAEDTRRYFFASRMKNGLFAYIISPGRGFYFQTLRDKKWISPHFNFDWYKQPQWKTGTWYHLAVTWGRGEPTIFYVNGSLVYSCNEESGAPLAAKTSVFIGCRENQKAQADALMDEFMVFNRVLSGDEIIKLATIKKAENKK